MRIDRLVAILEAVALSGRPASTAQVQQATGLARPTCHRLLRSLTDAGLLVDRDANARFSLGPRLLRIAALGRSDADVTLAARATLQQAADQFGEATFLSRLRDGGVEIIEVRMPADPARAYMHPGLGFRPLHACSCSKVIAAFADTGFQQEILSGPFKAYTAHTKTSAKALAHEFTAIRRRGYAECVEEIENGVSSVAAPVIIEPVGAVFSVGTIGPVRRFTTRYRVGLGASLKNHAATIGAAIALAGG